MKLQTAFVTGATGLLGNNLVRELVNRGVAVKALVRSPEKAARQFGSLAGIELVHGDMADVGAFSAAMRACDVVFHTAAFFRDNYKGGRHWEMLKRINVDGSAALIAQAHRHGVRRFVQTSSIAVLNGVPGKAIDETSLRDPADADDYYRSKILADHAVSDFLKMHPEMHACFILPGWMWGPGDIGPTSSGQVALDTVLGKLPGLVPGSFSVVDARDVALAHIAAAERGRSGERYLAAGRHMTMRELIPMIGRIARVDTPQRMLPVPLLFALAGLQEIYARLTGKPILLSIATVQLMVKEADRTRFSHAKSERELGLKFRPVDDTLREVIVWYREHKWLPGLPVEDDGLQHP
ncbi:dihydroflavonol-4-reductase [Collimonas sp. OK242]|jgi:dihydroflavonol-4-reductase|uniref:SDR family oxidoreductase n=1 Tax=Collimonas sp. OK242 TaxID=1798195 RepID=UPI000897BE49|nr:SDR family oxidoreductase [Collimonas sp. OK242]SDY31006.1 dihydroflavonol-4-reductase [Collimonas sp. OK242]